MENATVSDPVVGGYANPERALYLGGRDQDPRSLWDGLLGRVTITAEGRMMSVVCDGRKELPAGVSREYSSSCGNYAYDCEKIVTRVDAASDPSRIGSDQVRGAL